MHDYGQGIRELQRQIEQLNAEIGVQLRKLGEHLSYQDAAVLHNDQLKQLHRRIHELRHRLPESRQQVKLILQTGQRIRRKGEDHGLNVVAAQIEPLKGLVDRLIDQVIV